MLYRLPANMPLLQSMTACSRQTRPKKLIARWKSDQGKYTAHRIFPPGVTQHRSI
jgi:hypothetical protein